MDKKSFQEIKNKTSVALDKQAIDLRNQLWQLRIDLAAGKVKNVKEIRSVKKDIARIWTLIQQKNVCSSE